VIHRFDPRRANGRLRVLVRSWRPAHYVLLLLAHVHLLTSGGKAGGWDWQDIFYPWADALRLSILKYHQFPWWNPWSMSGQPFFAEPQTAVLAPDTLFLVAFGAVVGYKLAIIFYVFVGYEGSRFVCRHLFGRTAFVEGCSVIPALVPALALHLSVGHVVLLLFWFFPWLLGLALTWRQSARHSLAFGIVIGCFLLSYLHYCILIGFSITGAVVLVQLIRSFRSPGVWLKAALVLCTALGIGLTHVCLTVAFISGFPRAETEHYPIVASIAEVWTTLVAPLQNRTARFHIAGLAWWELGSYVGLLALLLACVGWWRGDRKLRALHLGALLCLLLAWNNRDRFLPGYWMHVTQPWKTMVVTTRWRLFACYLLLVGAVQGLVAIQRSGRFKLAVLLATLVTLDLAFHVHYAYRDTFRAAPPAFTEAPDPPQTVRDRPDDVWRHLRMNLVSMGAEFALLGYREHLPKRDHIGTPGYRGDFVGTKPLVMQRWSPNRIVLTASPGDTLTFNVNPSSYWIMNGQRLFPTYRAMEPDKPFRVVVPASGQIELLARPPHWVALLFVQGLFALLAVLLFRRAAGAQAKRVEEPAAASRMRGLAPLHASERRLPHSASD
jgi:hypothetical protein